MPACTRPALSSAIAIFPSTCRSAATSKDNDIISQYPMGPLNDLGLLKMDFLGIEDADRDRGHGEVDPKSACRIFRSKTFRSMTQPASLSTIAAKRLACSKWNRAG